MAPIYIERMLIPYKPQRSLRSSEFRQLVVPHLWRPSGIVFPMITRSYFASKRCPEVIHHQLLCGCNTELSVRINILSIFRVRLYVFVDYRHGVRGQVKIIQKIREKLWLVRPDPPTPLSIFYIFLETFWNMKTTQKTRKNTKFPKKS